MDIIQRSQAGDETAFAALFDKYKNLVYRTAYLMLGDTQEAEDALQEVFLRVYRSLDTYDPSRGAFTTWLHQITVNHCLNQLRKRRPPGADEDSVPWGELPLERGEAQPSPSDLIESSDEIWQSLRRLSGKLRAVIVLRYYWDLPYDEIGQILGIPVGTVKSRMNAALNAMREDLLDCESAAEESQNNGQISESWWLGR